MPRHELCSAPIRFPFGSAFAIEHFELGRGQSGQIIAAEWVLAGQVTAIPKKVLSMFASLRAARRHRRSSQSNRRQNRSRPLLDCRPARLETLERRAMLTATLDIIPFGSPTNTVQGSLIDYSYIINGLGANNVVVTDTLPTGIDLISASSSTGTVSVANGKVTFDLGTLPNGQARFDVKVTPTGADTLVNQVTATASNAASQTVTNTLSAQGAGSLSTDLQVTGSTSPSQVAPGQELQYNYTITNNDTHNTATSVALTDDLPTGVAFLGATSDTFPASETDGVVSASVGNVAPGQTKHVAIDLMALSAGSVTNSAFVTTDAGDPNLANNQMSTTSTVGQAGSSAADLVVTITPPAGTPNTGQMSTYTVTVTNSAATTASNVTLFDRLPDFDPYLYATASQGTISHAGDMVTANIGSLAGGKSATLTFAIDTVEPLIDYAAAATDSGQVDPSNAVATNTLNIDDRPPAAAALVLNVSDSAGSANVLTGQPVTYTITVTNQAATNTATNTVVTVPLPPGVAFVSAQSHSGTTSSGTSLGTVNVINGSVVDKLGDVAAGASATLTLVVTPIQVGEIPIESVATTDAGTDNTDPSINNDDNVDAVGAGSGAPDLEVTNTDNTTGGLAQVGQQVTYTVTVKNVSASNSAANALLTDVLSPNETYVSASGTSGAVSQTNGVVSDNIGTLAPGQSETLTIVASIGQAGTISDTAVATTSSGVINPATISATDTISTGTSVGSADLATSVSHSSNNATIVPGQALTYTIQVVNNSPTNNAGGVRIDDTLPSGVVPVSAISSLTTSGGATSQGTVTVGGGSISDNFGTLPAGQTAVLTLVVMPTQAGTITDTATASTTSGDPDTSNNTANDTATVAAAPNSAAEFSISQSTSPAIGNVAQQLIYTVTIKNTSTNDASNVVLADMLPATLSYLASHSATGTIGNSAGTVTWNIGTLAAGATATATITVDPISPVTVKNTVVATTDSGVADATQSVNTLTTFINGGTGGGANVSITGAASPSPVSLGQQLTYTLTVTNSGAIDADSVTVSDTLPAGVSIISDSASQGSVSVSGGTLTANLGLLPPETTATVTIIVAPAAAGTLTDTASVSTTSANGSQQTTATVTTTVNSGQSGACYLPGQPGDGTDATFIRNLYRELLDRDPDPAGQAYWQNYLQTGGNFAASLRQHLMVEAFLGSGEYRAHLVGCIYQQFLHRQADSGGLQFFVGQLNAGVGERVVIGEIVGSGEYLVDQGGTPQGFVDALYRDVLGRAPDAGGEAFWASLAGSPQVSRDQIAEAFLGTGEADHLVIDNPSGAGALAALTGNGWNQLYFQGNLSAQARNIFFAELASQPSYSAVIRNMLETAEYFNAADALAPS